MTSPEASQRPTHVSHRQRVLIVDDKPQNLTLLEALLGRMNVEVVSAVGGNRGIELFSKDPLGFDLVLLDVMMPEVDGLSALAAMRGATPSDEHVPIILITGMTNREDRMRGLEAGADDFITKPIEVNEVRCRVRTFLALRLAQRQLKARSVELERLQRAKTELTSMVVHDLKNPLAVITSNLNWLGKHITMGRSVTPAFVEAVTDAQFGSTRLLALVGGLIDIEKAESGQLAVRPVLCELVGLLEGLASRYRQEAEERHLSIVVSADPLEVVLDPELLQRVLENLIENALRYTPAKGRITLEARAVGVWYEIVVGNTGDAIPESLRWALFEKHVSSELKKIGGRNLGIGLYFCRLAARAHGGDIELETNAEWPTRFVVRLPAHDQLSRRSPAA